MKPFFAYFLFFLSIFVCPDMLYPQRVEKRLSGDDVAWRIWLDRHASWQEDSLYLPGDFVLSDLPSNAPTCGWDSLYEKGDECRLPTTVEEQYGTSHDWTYHGVSWFSSTFRLSSKWKDKRILLDVGKYNHRIEVFVNERLVGYDAVGLLPYQCDITDAINYAGENRIAFRVTGVGGNRGWEDYFVIKWGKQTLLPDKDYSGIGGDVTLTGVDKSFVSDIFVQNLQPAKSNRIEVEASIYHSEEEDKKASYEIEISDDRTGKILFKRNYSCVLQHGMNKISRRLTVAQAKLWSAESPDLYNCSVSLLTDDSRDLYSQRFGFRVFEVKEKGNRTHYYLNGERIRLRSAIDWSIYAFNGMFPTEAVAKRNIESVKKAGHNSLNFHRRAGDPLLFKHADMMGVYLYEEPGGFHSGGQRSNIDTFPFAKRQIYERLKRMVLRDRNHPSLLIYTLCNEDNMWTNAREMGMRIVHKYDPTRLIVNSSGGVGGGASKGGIAHIRPYEQEIRMDYNDHHTVWAPVTLVESDLNKEASNLKAGAYADHVTNDSSSITYWGEVRCYAGTFNYPLIYSQGKKEGKGYDLSMYASQAGKVEELFNSCCLKGMGRGEIQSAYDLTRYAGQGQYYTNGRLEQVIMSNDFSDGYAINGWTPGPDMPDEWSSAMLDQNRNMNSYAENISYWNRPLQIAIMRLNGKYVVPDDTVRFNIFLINEHKIPQGDYELRLRLKDGSGAYTAYSRRIPVSVRGGDVYAQTIYKDLEIIVDSSWVSGYLTLEGKLFSGGRLVTDGAEQVLLKNRKSQCERLKDFRISVVDWKKAETALKEAGVSLLDDPSKASVILMGTGCSGQKWDRVLDAVRKGANLILQMDSIDGCTLFEKGLISTPIAYWGGTQSGHWDGNGSSYIDVFAGDQAMAKAGIISTRSWEADGGPRGFYPFRSDYKQRAYGLYFAHQFKNNPSFKEEKNTLVTYGEIEYGKGHILLNTSYWVDADSAFSDLLFFNMIDYYCR